MENKTKERWDKHYKGCSDKYPTAAEVLSKNRHLLPTQGVALDLACGRGANALFLAENGLETTAWDISSAALEKLSFQANEKKLIIDTEVRNVSEQPPEANTFDIIVVSRFLDRNLIGQIKNAIKPKGMIFYQTFTKNKVNESGPSNPDYLLDRNELLNFFIDWKIIVYREEGSIGNTNEGFRNQAMLIAEKTC